MRISIVLPTRNEELLIKSTLKNIVRYLKKRKINDYEILVVLNGCVDSTEKLVNQGFLVDKRIKVLHSRSGYGFSMKKGLKEAKGDYVIIYNVDFYDLGMIDLTSIDLYGKDMIIGSKKTFWSEDKRPIYRRIISTLFNLYLKVFFGFKGSDTHGVKIMKKSVVKKILPKCKTNSDIFDTEFVLRTQYMGYKLSDFPVHITEKRPPRFSQRLLQTFVDILALTKALEDEKKNN